MELRVLRYFLMVAREGNITRAANALHVTQPTLSRQLMDLEEELDCKLLVRGSHSVRLTEEGVLLKKRAEDILEMVRRTEEEFSECEGVCGDVHIGGGETIAMTEIAAIARDLSEEYPDIRYHLYSGNADDVTERLDKGLLDFGVLIEPADLHKYDSLTLPGVKDVWGVIMRKDSALARRKTVRRGDLSELPLLFSRQVRNRTSRNEFCEWFGGDFDSLNIVGTFNLLFNAAVMVRQGFGYAVTLDKIADTSESSELCFRPLEPKLVAGLDVVWKKDRLFSPAARLFLDRMKDKFSKGDR